GPPKEENRIASKGRASPRRAWVGESGAAVRGAGIWVVVSVMVWSSVKVVRAGRRPGSGQERGDVLEVLEAAAGVEGELVAHVQARIGVAQVAHHVDEVVQIIGLEGEQPLVI